MRSMRILLLELGHSCHERHRALERVRGDADRERGAHEVVVGLGRGEAGGRDGLAGEMEASSHNAAGSRGRQVVVHRAWKGGCVCVEYSFVE